MAATTTNDNDSKKRTGCPPLEWNAIEYFYRTSDAAYHVAADAETEHTLRIDGITAGHACAWLKFEVVKSTDESPDKSKGKGKAADHNGDSGTSSTGSAPLEPDALEELVTQVAALQVAPVPKLGQKPKVVSEEQRRRAANNKQRELGQRIVIEKLNEDTIALQSVQPDIDTSRDVVEFGFKYDYTATEPVTKAEARSIERQLLRAGTGVVAGNVGARNGYIDGRYANHNVSAKIETDDVMFPVVNIFINTQWQTAPGLNNAIRVRVGLSHYNVPDVEAGYTIRLLSGSVDADVDHYMAATGAVASRDAVRADVFGSGSVTEVKFHVRGDEQDVTNLHAPDSVFGPTVEQFLSLRAILAQDHTVTLYLKLDAVSELAANKDRMLAFALSESAKSPYRELLLPVDQQDFIFAPKQVAQAEQLPNIVQRARVSFPDADSLLSTVFWGALNELSEAAAQGGLSYDNVQIRAWKIARSAGTSALVLIDTGNCKELPRLEAGDRLTFNIPALSRGFEASACWTGRVLGHAPGSNVGDVACLINSPRNTDGEHLVPLPDELAGVQSETELGTAATWHALLATIDAAPVYLAAMALMPPSGNEKLVYRTMRQLVDRIQYEQTRDPHGRSVLLELLMNRRQDRLPLVNLLAEMPQDLIAEFKAQLPEEGGQRALVDYLTRLQGGVGIVDAVAGSGKTHWAMLLVSYMVRASLARHDTKPFQAVLATSINNNGNGICAKIVSMLQPIKQDALVVRLYPSYLERKVFDITRAKVNVEPQDRVQLYPLRQALRAATGVTTAEPAATEASTAEPAATEVTTAEPAATEATTDEPAATEATTDEPAATEATTDEPAVNATSKPGPSFDLEEREEALRQVHPSDVAASFLSFVRTSQEYETDVRDRRVTQATLKYSAGWHLARLCGLLEEHREVHPGYQLVRSKVDAVATTDASQVTDDMRDELGNEIYKGICQILRSADVIVATADVAAEVRTVCSAEPDLVIADEAGKLPEILGIALLTSFPTAKARIFLLDHGQIGPVVHSSGQNNIFAPQLRIPLPVRLTMGGHRTAAMTHQQRYHPEVCDALQAISKGDFMHTSSAYKLKHEDLYARIKNAFNSRLGIMAVDIKVTGLARNHPTAEEQVVGSTRSKTNPAVLNAGFNIVRKVLQLADGVISMQDCQIISGYRADLALAETLRRSLSLGGNAMQLPGAAGSWSDLALSTVDAAQGGERFVTVVVFTPAENTTGNKSRGGAGHWDDARRLFTALTRTTGVVFFVGNFNAATWDQTGPIARIMEALHNQSAKVPLPDDCYEVIPILSDTPATFAAHRKIDNLPPCTVSTAPVAATAGDDTAGDGWGDNAADATTNTGAWGDNTAGEDAREPHDGGESDSDGDSSSDGDHDDTGPADASTGGGSWQNRGLLSDQGW